MALTLPSSAALPSDSPEPRDPALRLASGATMALRVAAGARITVSAGRLWLTQSNDPDDHFLAPGQHFVARQPGRVVLEGDAAATTRFRITPAR
jgi:hypothetical protein